LLSDSDFDDLIIEDSDGLILSAAIGSAKNMLTHTETVQQLTNGSDGSKPTTFTQFVYSTKRDSFRNRRPNTSRPSSIHVDDFMANEKAKQPKRSLSSSFSDLSSTNLLRSSSNKSNESGSHSFRDDRISSHGSRMGFYRDQWGSLEKGMKVSSSARTSSSSYWDGRIHWRGINSDERRNSTISKSGEISPTSSSSSLSSSSHHLYSYPEYKWKEYPNENWGEKFSSRSISSIRSRSPSAISSSKYAYTQSASVFSGSSSRKYYNERKSSPSNWIPSERENSHSSSYEPYRKIDEWTADTDPHKTTKRSGSSLLARNYYGRNKEENQYADSSFQMRSRSSQREPYHQSERSYYSGESSLQRFPMKVSSPPKSQRQSLSYYQSDENDHHHSQSQYHQRQEERSPIYRHYQHHQNQTSRSSMWS